MEPRATRHATSGIMSAGSRMVSSANDSSRWMHESTSSRTCTSSWPMVSCIEKNESMRWICLVSAMRCAKARSSSISARTVAAGSVHTSLMRSARSDAVQRASGPPSTLDSPSSQPGKHERTIHEPPDGFSSHTPSRPLLTTKMLRDGSPSVTSISCGASVRRFRSQARWSRWACVRFWKLRASKTLSIGLRRARLCSSRAWTGEPAKASRPDISSAIAAALSSAGRSKRSANSRAAASR